MSSSSLFPESPRPPSQQSSLSSVEVLQSADDDDASSRFRRKRADLGESLDGAFAGIEALRDEVEALKDEASEKRSVQCSAESKPYKPDTSLTHQARLKALILGHFGPKPVGFRLPLPPPPLIAGHLMYGTNE